MAKIELWFRRITLTFALVTTLALIANFAVMIWAQNEFTGPESIVNLHSEMLARHGTLYYDLKNYPFTICAYTPIVYNLQAALIRIGFTSAHAGRAISFLAMLGIFAMVWRLALLYTSDRYCAAIALLSTAAASVLMMWGTTGQVDMLAIFFSLAAFEQFSRYYLLGESTLWWAGVFAGLAIFTKQTTLACPTAIFVLLFMERKRVALIFGALFLSITGGAMLGLNALLDGRFFTNTIFANVNAFMLSKLGGHIYYFLATAGCLLLITALGLPKIRGKKLAPFVYLGFAIAMFLATAPKVGSDFNYQIESDVLLSLCAAIALHELKFFPLTFAGSKSWITLLQIPLAVHLAVNLRVTGNMLLARIVREKEFREQIVSLRPYVFTGRFISTDLNSVARLRGYIEVDPLVFSEMAEHKDVDRERVRRDIAYQKFVAICLWTDLSSTSTNPEIANLPEDQLAEVRKHYKFVAHIPGPYLDGLYVYQPQP